jgi:chemotaxis protein MotB
MKRVIQITAIFSLFVGILLTSCVSTKKFAASEAEADKFQNDYANATFQLKECNTQVKKLNDEKLSLQNEKSQLQDANSTSESNLKDLTKASNSTIAEQAKTLKDLQNIIQSQKDVMTKLKSSISDALMNYKSDELTVYIKDGNVYVSLEEKLLFKSGSDEVDHKGKKALKSLSDVLKDTKNISVAIEGHTDNVPISNKLFQDNWDLSTARATSIVRILTAENGFDSKRITASGKGQFHPVKTNNSDAGRSSNRRTEIILSPDLTELFSLLY